MVSTCGFLAHLCDCLSSGIMSKAPIVEARVPNRDKVQQNVYYFASRDMYFDSFKRGVFLKSETHSNVCVSSYTSLSIYSNYTIDTRLDMNAYVGIQVSCI